MNLFVMTLFTDPLYYFSWVLIMMFSICIHEYAHALIALHCGDDTPVQTGHITLNPLVQMGSMSIVLLLIIGIGWGSVQVNQNRLRSRAAIAGVAFAGPAVNLLLCLVFALLAVISGYSFDFLPNSRMLDAFFHWGSIANGVLFVFNMLPLPPLDGYSILSAWLSPTSRIMQQWANYSWILILIIFVTPVGSFIWRLGSAISHVFVHGFVGLFNLIIF